MFLSPTEVIRHLGISRNTLNNLRARGDFIPAHRVSERRIGFDPTEFEAWLQGRTTQ